MCGIVGKFYFDRRTYDSSDMATMMRAISHRGPDSSGQYGDGRVALGFQRLSIIDTASGHQPLFNETKSLVLVANGEIYNYKEFIPLLIAKGHNFSTRSDCEVILHLYEEYGIDFISRLNGMFAFCLYDCAKGLLYIARDRVGIKPFYYHRGDKCVVFGSEIKGILAANDVEASERDDILSEYLCFRHLANFSTFFSSINSIEPGSHMTLSRDGCSVSRYWGSSSSIQTSNSERALVEAVDAALSSSVQRQMMTDVPLGAQLSGGVDSSLVSKLASQYAPGFKTFTVSFAERSYDESSYARLLADSAGLEYHQIRIDPHEFADNLPQVIWYHDEPLCHPNSVHMYLLCKYAKEHVKVLLTGEGADELFAGYPRYMICRLGEMYNTLSPMLARSIKTFLSWIPHRKMKKLSNNLGLSSRDLVFWNAAFARAEKTAWLMDGADMNFKARGDLLDSTWNDSLSLFDNLLLFEQRSYLQPILMRQDKMSMAASVESRVPVLDNQMLAIANSIPYTSKIRCFTPKHLFKKVAERHISAKIVYKKKVGFGVPVDEWLRDSSGLGRYLDLLLDVSGSISAVSKSRLEKMVLEHRNHNANHGDILWPLINYVIWKDKFFR